MNCWMQQGPEIVFVLLGKYGDILLLSPAFKKVADAIGRPITLMVSREFASVTEGMSYIRPWVVDFHWWKGVAQAYALAQRSGKITVNVKWWDMPKGRPPFAVSEEATVTLDVHGTVVRVPSREWDSYQSSIWRYAGFTVQQMMDWPLVIDQRSPEREEALRNQWFKTDKPKLLTNLDGNGTSPFPYFGTVDPLLRATGMERVDLRAVRAERIYDLLGLYDHAAGLVTSDTATLHLAHASTIPYIALVNNGGNGSVPRGNCIAKIRYKDVSASISKIKTLLQWIERGSHHRYRRDSGLESQRARRSDPSDAQCLAPV